MVEAPAEPATFAAYILLSEPVQFTLDEIAEALIEDFPALDLELADLHGTDEILDTATRISATLTLRGGQDAAPVCLARLPGLRPFEPLPIPTRQRLRCPDIEARLSRATSYICLAAGVEGGDAARCFRVARLISCMAAVFARLPVALATYWKSGDHFISPEATHAMAEKAVAGDWPIEDWIGIRLDQDTSEISGAALWSGSTVGFSAFKPFEFMLPLAPIAADKVGSSLLGAAAMGLIKGDEFVDGGALGIEGTPRSRSYRLRFARAGQAGVARDTMIILHPETHFDVTAALRPTPPPPSTTPAGKPGHRATGDARRRGGWGRMIWSARSP